MSKILKSVIQDIINDNTESAQVSMHSYIVAKTQEVSGLTEGAEDKYSHAEITEGINELVSTFSDKAERFMPDIADWEEDLGKNPTIGDFKNKVVECFYDFYPEYTEDIGISDELIEFIVENHKENLVIAIAKYLKKNFMSR